MSVKQHIPSAQTKNRHEKSELDTELRRLENEKRNELKMINNEKQRFKAKYSRLNYSIDTGISEASTLRVYDRTGSKEQDTTSFDFDHIHSLLFTNGEIDIEKILCLHLISSHTTDSLAPTVRTARTRNIPKEHSPVERLIDRSKNKHGNNKLTKTLPTYVLDIPDSNKDNKKKSIGEDENSSVNNLDPRLAARLIVNEKILNLIQTVLGALQDSNPEKMQELIDMSSDIRQIKAVFRKAEIQEFLKTLKSHALISSCESFVLTAQYKVKPIHLEIKTVSGNLENVVKHIHKSILQYPSRSTWQKMYEESVIGKDIAEEEEEAKVKAATVKGKKEVKPVDEKISMEQRKAVKEREREKRPSADSQIDKMLGRHVKTDFIARNKEAITNVKKKEYDEDYIPQFRRVSRDSQASSNSGGSGNRRRSSLNAAISPPSKVSKVDNNLLEESNKPEEDIGTTSSKSDSGSIRLELLQLTNYNTKKRKSDSSERSYIKQTTCAACMQKFKTPLPSPKTPRITRLQESSEEKLTTTLGLRTNTAQRISNLIVKEKFALDAAIKRYSLDSNASKTGNAKTQGGHRYSLDSVELNAIDLAKIDQEIREKETKKKLEKFLDE